eukprot:9359925-Pyramimonas_sp.AAC.1
MTNMPELAPELKKGCPGDWGPEQHRNVLLTGGVARKAQAHPPILARCVLRAVKEAMDKEGSLSRQAEATAGLVPTEPDTYEQGRSLLEDSERYWDDVNGGWLDPAMVRKAREEE